MKNVHSLPVFNIWNEKLSKVLAGNWIFNRFRRLLQFIFSNSCHICLNCYRKRDNSGQFNARSPDLGWCLKMRGWLQSAFGVVWLTPGQPFYPNRPVAWALKGVSQKFFSYISKTVNISRILFYCRKDPYYKAYKSLQGSNLLDDSLLELLPLKGKKLSF